MSVDWISLIMLRVTGCHYVNIVFLEYFIDHSVIVALCLSEELWISCWNW